MVKPLILYNDTRPDAVIKALFPHSVTRAIKDTEFNTSKHVHSPLNDSTDSIVYLVTHTKSREDLAKLYSAHVGVREWFPPLVFLMHGAPSLQSLEFSSGQNVVPTEQLLPIKVLHVAGLTDTTGITVALQNCLQEVNQRHLLLRYLAFKTSTFNTSSSQQVPAMPVITSVNIHHLDQGKSSIAVHGEYGMIILSDQSVDEAGALDEAVKQRLVDADKIVGTLLCDTNNEITTVYGPFSKNRISEQSYADVATDNNAELIENMQALVSLHSSTFSQQQQPKNGSRSDNPYTLSRDVGVTDLNSFLHSLLACDEWKGLYNASESALSTGEYNASLYGLLQANSSKVELNGTFSYSTIDGIAKNIDNTKNEIVKIKGMLTRVDEKNATDVVIAQSEQFYKEIGDTLETLKSVYEQDPSWIEPDSTTFDAVLYTVGKSINPELYTHDDSISINGFVHAIDFTKALDDNIGNRTRYMTMYHKSRNAFLQLCYIEYIGRYCYLNSSSSQDSKETAVSMAPILNNILKHWSAPGKGVATPSSSSKIGSRIPDRTKLVIGHHPIPVHLYGVEHLQGVVRELVYDQDPSSSSSTGPRVLLPSHKTKTKTNTKGINAFDLSKALDLVKTGSDVDLTNTLVTWYTAKLFLENEHAKRKMSPTKRGQLQAKFESMQDELNQCVSLHQTSCS